MSRVAHYEDQRRRAAEFVNKAVSTALMAGPPADLEPPTVSGGWQDGPFDGQEQFIRTAIDEFKKHAPEISLDIPSADFTTWPPGHVYAHATKMSRWNKNSASLQSSMGMFHVRHAFWRFIAASIVYRKRLPDWPGINWTVPESFHLNTEVRPNKFLAIVHGWADSCLRSAGVIK